MIKNKVAIYDKSAYFLKTGLRIHRNGSAKK